eukprot:855425-Amphidinium_carterae.1
MATHPPISTKTYSVVFCVGVGTAALFAPSSVHRLPYWLLVLLTQPLKLVLFIIVGVLAIASNSPCEFRQKT